MVRVGDLLRLRNQGLTYPNRWLRRTSQVFLELDGRLAGEIHDEHVWKDGGD